MTKRTSTSLAEYEVSNFCGDCHTCETMCETGIGMLNSWTSKEVADACDLLGESNKYLKELRSLEGGVNHE